MKNISILFFLFALNFSIKAQSIAGGTVILNNINVITQDFSDSITTSSKSDVVISGMSISPQTGKYIALFNAQYKSRTGEKIAGFTTSKGVNDLETFYNQLIAIPTTNTTHTLVFGNGETLNPGVYTIGGAVSIAGTLTLDGGGDPNALFIIRAVSAAFNTGASTTVILKNGAKANNVFWIAGGAIGLGASTIIKGTIIAHSGAISLGAGSSLEGKVFSNTGAIDLNNVTAILPSPTTSTYADCGSLANLILFSTSGAISNTANSIVTGDIGSNLGVISGFGAPSVLNGNIYGPDTPSNNTIINAIGSFSIYQNGILVANSTRTSVSNNSIITLQSVINVTVGGQSLDVRWKVDNGPLSLINRNFTLINVH